MENTIRPDFVIIPSQVMFCENLQPLDKTVYGIIYWLEHLKEGKCIASNAYLAKMCGSTGETITNCLLRLETNGFIKRTFKDEARKIRHAIKTLVAYRVPSNDGTVPSNDGMGVPSNDGHISKSNLKEEKQNNIPSELSSQVQKVMEIFYTINPTINWGNKTSRKAAANLIQKFGLEGALHMAEAAVSIQGQPYAPTVATPYQLKEKLASVKAFFDKRKNDKPKIANISND